MVSGARTGDHISGTYQGPLLGLTCTDRRMGYEARGNLNATLSAHEISGELQLVPDLNGDQPTFVLHFESRLP